MSHGENLSVMARQALYNRVFKSTLCWIDGCNYIFVANQTESSPPILGLICESFVNFRRKGHIQISHAF